jgi:pimeloyl-ACP methyl ester carboxylesterase
MGYEDTCSYRPLRHLADALAQAGHVVLRLDWPGLGDSAGENALPQQISHCTQSIQAAIQQLKNRGFAQVAAIGLRIGGLLALSVPELDALALLLLPQRGKAYLREERAFHKMAAQAFGPPPADAPVLPAQAVEAGGFVYAPEAVLALEALVAADLAAQSRCKRVLLVEAEGRNPATAVAQAFEQAGASVSVTQGNFGNLFENAYIASMDPKVQQEILAWFETTDRCAIAPPQSPCRRGLLSLRGCLKRGEGSYQGLSAPPQRELRRGPPGRSF